MWDLSGRRFAGFVDAADLQQLRRGGVVGLQRRVADAEALLQHRLELGSAGMAVLFGVDDDVSRQGREA